MKTDRTDVTFVSSIDEYLHKIKQQPLIKRVWLLVGAQIIALFKAHDLIDECIITVIPKVLHEGIALPGNIFDGMAELLLNNFLEVLLRKDICVNQYLKSI